MYTNIIFDLDGTLIESLPGIAHALNEAMVQQKLAPHSLSAVRGFIGDGSYTLCARAVANQSQITIQRVHQSFLENYSKNWQVGTQIYDGINDLLVSLKSSNCTLSILSNKPHNFTTEIVEYLFPKNTFDLVLGQRPNIDQKPDPSGVYEILTALNHRPNDSVLIGDSTVDIITATNAKINSIGVTWGYHNPQQIIAASPDHIAENVADLTNILTQ